LGLKLRSFCQASCDVTLNSPSARSGWLLGRVIRRVSAYNRYTWTQSHRVASFKAPFITTIKVKTCSCKLQHATGNFLAAAIKLARKWPAPKRSYALDACRSVGRSSGRIIHLSLALAIIRQAFVRRSFRSFAGGGAVPLTITDELRIFIDWTEFRCGWLQVTLLCGR